MATISERDERLLRRLGTTQRLAAALGLFLALAGVGYVTWAVLLFDPRADPHEQPRWDRPVAGIATLYDRFNPLLNAIRPQTENEELLLSGVKANLRFSTGLLILATRVLIGTIFALGGLAALTVVVERARLLKVIEQLRK